MRWHHYICSQIHFGLDLPTGIIYWKHNSFGYPYPLTGFDIYSYITGVVACAVMHMANTHLSDAEKQFLLNRHLSDADVCLIPTETFVWLMCGRGRHLSDVEKGFYLTGVWDRHRHLSNVETGFVRNRHFSDADICLMPTKTFFWLVCKTDTDACPTQIFCLAYVWCRFRHLSD